MIFFDFHHHKNYENGIYNLDFQENATEIPFSAGIHPKDISENFVDDFERVKVLSQNPQCWAIGECGLDGLINIPQSLQEEIFLQHILWANEIRKPIIIHCVRRFSELLKFKKKANVPMAIHGFNKKKTIADELLHAGFYLSFGKAVLQNVSLQNLLKEIPLEKIFLETDDANFPIADLYLKVSEIKGITIEYLQEQILENLIKFREH
ncbi:MAG: TatD family hydrolase [Cruoricaptor ignavus]|nr:TatD family hydrolase [Cruoricaptor ignavus]